MAKNSQVSQSSFRNKLSTIGSFTSFVLLPCCSGFFFNLNLLDFLACFSITTKAAGVIFYLKFSPGWCRALTPKFFESAVNKDSGDICVFFHHQTWTDVSTRRSVPVATIEIMESLNLCLTARSEIYKKCCSTFYEYLWVV